MLLHATRWGQSDDMVSALFFMRCRFGSWTCPTDRLCRRLCCTCLDQPRSAMLLSAHMQACHRRARSFFQQCLAPLVLERWLPPPWVPCRVLARSRPPLVESLRALPLGERRRAATRSRFACRWRRRFAPRARSGGRRTSHRLGMQSTGPSVLVGMPRLGWLSFRRSRGPRVCRQRGALDRHLLQAGCRALA